MARNTILQVVGEGVSKFASLALYVVVARVGGSEEFGNLIFALSLSLLATSVAGFGIESLVVRGVAREREVAGRLLSNAIALKLVFGSLGVAAAIAVTLIASYSGEVRVAVAVLSVGAVVDLIAKSYFAVFQALDDMRPMAACTLIQRYTTAVGGIALVLLGAHVEALSFAFLAGSVATLAIAVWWLARHGVSVDRRPSATGAWALARQSVNLGVTQVFSTVLFRADATMLSLYKGNLAVGLYGVAYRLLESTLFLTYSFTAAVAPTLARVRRDSVPSVARVFESACKVLALVMVPVGDAMVLFPQAIVHLIYGARYGSADSVMRLLGGATVTYALAYLASYTLVTQDRDRVLPWVHAAVAIQNIALNLILIPSLSYNGAALSTTISEITRTVALMWYAVRATGPIRILRILLAPSVGTAMMACVALVLGTSFACLLLAGLAYAGSVLVVERFAFPDDLSFVRRAILRRPVAGL